MMHYFHSLGIHEHDEVLYEMGMKEKEHEMYFLERVKNSKLLPLFEKVFRWGRGRSKNDVDLENQLAVESSHLYCRRGHGVADEAAKIEMITGDPSLRSG